MEIDFFVIDKSDWWPTMLAWVGALISLGTLVWTIYIHFKENKAKTSCAWRITKIKQRSVVHIIHCNVFAKLNN